jgi:thiol-disulfide isomerase/thioredoxin
MKFYIILILLLALQVNVCSQNLITIDQDIDKAKAIALKENKLILIDFYTTWCVPCKKLDKLIFENDSIRKILNQNFVLLKYNAEKDTVFNLSKKYHIFSYPTGLILNKEGFVLNKIFGFKGNDFKSLSESVHKFTIEAIALNEENKIINGYSNKVDISKYPDFYKKFVNRQKTNLDSSQFLSYWKNSKDILSEEYFSTLIYFGNQVPAFVSDLAEKNREKYRQLFGGLETDILFYKLSSSVIDNAISTKSDENFKKAIDFTKRNLDTSWTKTLIPRYKIDFLTSQGKWEEVYSINENLKKENKFSDDDINTFSWEVYEKCDDKNVIIKCVQLMKELIDKKPDYANLDTYACILYKSGNKIESKRIAVLAIETGKKNNESTRSTEKFLKSLQETN